MKITEAALRKLVREVLLKESKTYVNHVLVKEKIKKNVDEFFFHKDIPGLDIDKENLKSLMEEIAIMESGYLVGDEVKHLNDVDGVGADGVFQLTSIAIDEIMSDKMKKTKVSWDASSAASTAWNEQPRGDWTKYLGMQVSAAIMYVLWRWFHSAGKPDLGSVASRSKFWKQWYNTTDDPHGTAQGYVDKIKEFQAYM